MSKIDNEGLLAALLAKPVGKGSATRPSAPVDLTRELEVSGSTVTATLVDEPGSVNEGTALEFLESEGLDPDEWEVVSFRKSQWGDPENPLESVRFNFKRRHTSAERQIDLDDLLAVFDEHEPTPLPERETDHLDLPGVVIGIGDNQFGKIDGDGAAGTLKRSLLCVDAAAQRVERLLAWGFIRPRVHIAFLGDHIEGFVSQGGSNTWRTRLTLTEQIRLTRRLMQYAMIRFESLGVDLSLGAVGGNHDEAVRFGRKGVTRYDDSHDVESLIAVSDAAKLAGWDHVKFYVPEDDEMTIMVDVAGTNVLHAHGHQWSPGKHFEWWKGQAFNKGSNRHEADLLLAGHLHHEEIDTWGWRKYIGVPALESESTWYRHQKGTPGAPGVVLALTKDGLTDHVEIVRGGIPK